MLEQLKLVAVDNVSKKFCRSLKRSLWYGVQDLGSELIGRSVGGEHLRPDEFWALKDVSFSLRRGETLGLIGHNGAGKTTMLRMLNGLIKPDEGRIEVRGRMQALIALGAGFNPVLTGRENIYVNAAVLGISKAEVDKQFDEIVDFADIEEFIDTPVQSYSSGMRVRLGFAVAASMRPDILLVDEVLSVGDLAFRAKCRSRIEQLIRSGVAVILVSHNLHTISHTCSRAVVFARGRLIFEGDTAQAVDVYRSSLASESHMELSRSGTGEVIITDVEVLNEYNKVQAEFAIGDFVKLRVHYEAEVEVQDPIINVIVHGQGGEQVTGIRTDVDGVQLGKLVGIGYIDLIIPNFNLLPNVYTLTATLFHTSGYVYYDRVKEVAQIKVVGGLQINGTAYLPHSWHFPDPIHSRILPLLSTAPPASAPPASR